MVQSRQVQVATIVQKRKPFLAEVERIQRSLRKRQQILQSLEQLQTSIMNSGIASLADQVKDIKIPELCRRIDYALKELEKPRARFARNTLNIGVIGRARQGKSQLLRSLSDLDDAIIPTGNKDHCTGVRSLICHDPTQTPHGEIAFYSEHEFMDEVIKPYYDKLKLGPPPFSLDKFAQEPLPLLPANSNGYAVPGEQYRHLEEYKKNLPTYRSLINTKPRNVKTEEIREYVAQETLDGKSKYFKYMAVKEARIICTFKHPDVGQIALVDMPGLGDTGIGAEDRLIHALGEHIDIVLFVLMPTQVSAILADVDFNLYDLAYNSLGGLSVDRWSFMVLNHTNPPLFGDNGRNCQIIQGKITSGAGIGNNDRRIKVVDCLTADCSQSEEAKNIVLEGVLAYLVKEMTNLDMVYLTVWQNWLGRLQADITTELERAHLALSSGISRHFDNKQFNELFGSLWKALTGELESLIQKLAAASTTPNPTFTAYFKKTFEKCRADTGLPSEKDLMDVRNAENAYITAYNKYLDQMRTHLTHHFIDIDEQLRLQMDEVKQQVIQVFLHEGKLANLISGVTTQSVLGEMVIYPTLSPRQQEAFKMFANYELSFRGYFQSRIRGQHLVNMIPDKTAKKPQVPITATSVIKALQEVHKETVDKLEKTLNDLAHEPSLAAQAVIEEFVDQILRFVDAENDWRAFYQTEQEKIWVSEFAVTAKREQFRQKWQEMVKEAKVINSTDSLQFFKSSQQP